jgi:hypothetical protein
MSIDATYSEPGAALHQDASVAWTSIRGALGRRSSTVATREDEVTMAKLTAKQREKLPAKAFGLPERARSKKARKESGNYPMPDRDHAISAIRRSERERQRGNLTKDEFERINRKARKILRKKKKKANR